ncbi:ATPase subunit of ABC transporter with duplicated ATPase domains [Peribacillus deserti]|uniref:ATPase subunit of ABC transporter with duplicated ATPase domains n=1 Tax=Peribacillus deserti TaxID=673318 RepID=A0ABS2QKS4_9BACI|nr:hypothetical protein [Peribacillus deserti]MBM7693782.1 ATPase subunit of ABC transporter with duplicated ATPase domains [Peribacillus deserti]
MQLYQDISLLILDEPTNHLDIDSIETLEEALEDFKGTIFFISHDRYLINKIGERVIAVEDYAFKSYPGNYDYYRSVKVEKSLQNMKKPVVNVKKDKKQKNNPEDLKKEAEEANALTKIESLENEIREIDKAMAADLLDYEELNKVYCRKVELSKELDSVMTLWLSN